MCDFCNGDELLYEHRDEKQGRKATEEIYQYIDDKMLVTEIDSPMFSKVIQVPINYCPVCKEELKE